MPTVGKQNFSYDPAGIARARKAENATGKPMMQQSNYRGGVAPINPGGNPNQGAVNNFMNQNAIGDLADGGNMNPNTQDVSKLQNGLNFLNKGRPGYTPLKVDGQMGPKTRGTADMYLGRNRKV
jgi:hypothetical protein